MFTKSIHLYCKIVCYSFFLLKCYPALCQQPNIEKRGPTLVVINGSKTYKLYNIILRYSRGEDTSWAIVPPQLREEYLLPGDSLTTEPAVKEDIHVRSIEYKGVYHGKVIHQFYYTSFVIPLNHITKVVLANFYIPPPWWMSWWFAMLCVAFLVLVSFLIIRHRSFLRLKRNQEKLEQELKLQNERMRISSEMHDDIGSSLAGIKLQIEVLNNKMFASDIHSEISQINSSMSVVCSKVREVIWSLDSENDTLQNLTSFIYQQVHRLFDKTDIKAIVSIPENIPDIIFNGERRRHIYLIIKEALHNIIKHSNSASASVIFSTDNETLGIKIIDDGHGFEMNSEKSTVESMGLRNMKSRAEKLQSIFKIESSSNGTTVYLDIPFFNNAKNV